MPIGRIKFNESHLTDPLNILIIPTTDSAKKSKYLKNINIPRDTTKVIINNSFL